MTLKCRFSLFSFTCLLSICCLLLSASALATEIFIEIEDYKLGGEGVGYHDDNQRQGNYDNGRGETVDLEIADDGRANDANVGFVIAGEWLAYDIHIPVAGTYQLDIRTARNVSGSGGFHLEIDGSDITGLLSTPFTGGWQTYQTSSFGNIAFDAGYQTIRMVFDVNSFNVNWFRLTLSEPANINNTAPSITNIGSQTNVLGESIGLSVNATDIEGDTLTYSATGLPSQLTIDSGTGLITGTVTVAGTYNVSIIVGDNNGGSSISNFTWIINEAGQEPADFALETHTVDNVSSSAWTSINFNNDYVEPVIVCSARYINNTIPQVVRMRNAGSTSAEIQLQNPSNQPLGGNSRLLSHRSRELGTA